MLTSLRALKLGAALASQIAVSLVATAPARADDFYRGKTLTIVVGYAAGGGYDTNARLLARFLGGHIPGNPNVVATNMPGAGSLKALEYLENTAARDGTFIALFDFTQITNSLLTPASVKIDFRKYKWIGSIAQDLAVCYVWNRTQAKTLADVQKMSNLPMGRTNPGSSSDIEQKIFAKLFNVKVQSVAGYAGSAEAFLAVERGELDGGCLTWSSLPSNWITDGKINPILRLSSATAPDLPASVPSALDVAANDRDRQIINVLTAAGDLGKPLVANVTVPDERLTVLRSAFMATMADSAFLAEANRQRQPISPVAGEDAQKILDGFYATPPDIVAAAQKIAAD